MDRNTVIFFLASFGIMVLWYGLFPPQDRIPVDQNTPAVEEPATARDPGAGPGAKPSPVAGGGTGTAAGEAATSTSPAPGASPDAPERLPEQRIVVETDFYQATLTSHGGGLVGWTLSAYDDAALPDRPLVEMITPGSQQPLALATPLRGLGLGDLSALDYHVDQPDRHTVVFSANVRGVGVRKTYTFSPDDYQARLRIELDNGTDRHLRPNFATRWPARLRPSEGYFDFGLAAFTMDGDYEGFVIDPPKMLFGGGGSDEEATFSGVEWAAAQTRYFLAAIIPDNGREADVQFTPVEFEREALLLLKFREADVPPGTRLDREYRLYIGPKEPDRLEAFDADAGLHLSEAVPRGWLPSLTRAFERLLEWAYDVVPNYGVAILLITVLVRLVMAPLMARQMRSMKKLSAIQPDIKAVQEKYPDDREKQSQEMMAVYKKHGMSPLSMFGGCLPMFLQLPVFIGFYYALQSSISLRQQPFFGWIDDLSQPESIFTIPGLDIPVRVLPLLMGLSMFLQQKFTPNTMDPAQARMMLFMMPVMFTFLFYQFASGLVLYWFTSTLIGIGQQVLTNRRKD